MRGQVYIYIQYFMIVFISNGLINDVFFLAGIHRVETSRMVITCDYDPMMF